jgi:hypothetical protein
MKAKVLSFPLIYFGESGLFNGLRAEKIKKFAAVFISRFGPG